MKAIRIHQFGEPEVMMFQDVPDPCPSAGQILVRACAVGVNPVDAYIRAGWYAKPDLPLTPGFDAAGVVEAVGEAAQRFAPGDRVYVCGSLTGTYAQLILCDRQHVHPLPDGLTFEQGAAVGIPCATAYRALFQRGLARAGETVLIHGATGGVGTAAVQLALAAGLVVFATGGSASGRQMLLSLGAHHVLDHRAPDYFEHLMDLTGGRGVDLILEMLANVNLTRDLTVLARNGRVIVIGSRGRIEIDPRQTMARDADIRGMAVLNAPEADQQAFRAAIGAALENGTLRPVVGRTMPLAEAPAAHHAIMQGGSCGKIVLLP